MKAKEERKWCRKKNDEQFEKDLMKRGYLPKELLYDFRDEDCKRSEKYQVKTLKAKEEGKWWKRKETHELVRNLKDAGYMMEELFALFDLTVLKEAGFEAASPSVAQAAPAPHRLEKCLRARFPPRRRPTSTR